MSKLLQVLLCTAVLCLAVNSVFAETVTTTSGTVGAKADVNAYNAYLAQGKDVVTTGTVSDTTTNKGYIGTAQATISEHYDLAAGASAKIVLEPGLGKLGLLGTTLTSGAEGKVWKSGYRANVNVWSHVGIGWFNADGTPATVNGRWFGGTGTEASANVPGGTDMGLPENQTAYYKNPGVAYKSTGVMGSTNAAMSFVSTDWNSGSEGIYMNNANNGSASGRGSSWGDLGNFRNAALATSGQSLDTAKFTWVSIDFSEVTNANNGQTHFDNARIAQFNISNSDSGGSKDSANTKALRYVSGTDTVLDGVDTIAAGTIAYFKLNEISVQNFGLFGQVDMATGGNALTGNNSAWQPIKVNFLSVTETLASSSTVLQSDYVYAARKIGVAPSRPHQLDRCGSRRIGKTSNAQRSLRYEHRRYARRC
ncbi:hypothetical protein FACS1894189_7570 [Planctomycetales bacterium]|nr:hypothetical protein FACS1894189_7570 [Planctomycetales bacterium]